MHAPRWVDNNIIAQKQRDVIYQKHVRKVTEIIHNPKKSHGLDQNLIKQQQSLYNAKSFNMHFNENQRLNQINKQNQLLLDKLIDISEGKQSLIKHQLQNPPKEDKQSQRAMSHKRKQAALQIYTENQAMAQRLLNQRSFINKVQIQKEIEEYEKLRAHMQKVKPGSGKKRNVSVQPSHNLPPIIPHNQTISRNGSTNHRRKLKKISNSNTLNKSAYDINNHDNSLRYKKNGANQSFMNQSEADIIINQYDTYGGIQNSNSMPAYQQSYSANLHNPREREQQHYISHPGSIRGSQQMSPAAILEEDDQTDVGGQQTNQASHFYKPHTRTQSQNNNYAYDNNRQQNSNQQNHLNYSFDKQQNLQDHSSSAQQNYNHQNKENQPVQYSNPVKQESNPQIQTQTQQHPNQTNQQSQVSQQQDKMQPQTQPSQQHQSQASYQQTPQTIQQQQSPQSVKQQSSSSTVQQQQTQNNSIQQSKQQSQGISPQYSQQQLQSQPLTQQSQQKMPQNNN